jgi:small subunit ribosomal protein S20
LATHVSTLKRARQSEKRRVRNKIVKSALKTQAKRVLQAVEEKNLEKAGKALALTVPEIQRASSKKILHKRTAARKISRLAKKVNALKIPA